MVRAENHSDSIQSVVNKIACGPSLRSDGLSVEEM